MKISKKDQAEAISRVRAWVKPGDTISTILRHVSKSGMSRDISAIVIKGDRTISLDYNAHLILGWPMAKGDGVRAGGCGMDMGFHLVYSLSRTLFPSGFGCIGEGCPSNDHSNGDRDFTPHYDGTPRNSEEVGKDLKPYKHYHSDGGYALKQRWL